MISKSDFFGFFYNSEKSNFYLKKKKIFLKISKNIDKIKIINFIIKFYSIKLFNVNTLIIKGKKKRYKKYFFKRIIYKKVYIYFKNFKDFSIILNDKKRFFSK